MASADTLYLLVVLTSMGCRRRALGLKSAIHLRRTFYIACPYQRASTSNSGTFFNWKTSSILVWSKCLPYSRMPFNIYPTTSVFAPTSLKRWSQECTSELQQWSMWYAAVLVRIKHASSGKGQQRTTATMKTRYANSIQALMASPG